MNAPYYTRALSDKETEILSRDRARPAGNFRLVQGRLKVTTTITGYERRRVEIHFDHLTTTGVVYVAPIGNFAFLGEAPLDEMVAQIRRCTGPSGTNVDYVLELARALRQLDVTDPHVFELERLLL